MQTPFSLGKRSYYPWLFVVLAFVANAVVGTTFPAARLPEFLLSVTGAVAALVHFLYSQHGQNTAHFIQLFREFNARYDELNGGLNSIMQDVESDLLHNDETQLLYDYFNLCAEEYLFYKAGYIDKQAWCAWLNGMHHFASNPKIRNLWARELKSDSYYGFSLELISKAPGDES